MPTSELTLTARQATVEQILPGQVRVELRDPDMDKAKFEDSENSREDIYTSDSVEVQNLRDQIKVLEGENTDLLGDIGQLEDKVEDLKGELQELQEQD